LLLSACSQRLPSDPAAQIAEIQKRMDAAPTSFKKCSWLVHAADNPTTAARDLLLQSLRAPHPILSGTAGSLLKVRWIRDPETRREVRAYYLDPKNSLRNREILYDQLLRHVREQYPDLADLPPNPPTLPGVPHIASAAKGGDGKEGGTGGKGGGP
jgi:hypothetical protein